MSSTPRTGADAASAAEGDHPQPHPGCGRGHLPHRSLRGAATTSYGQVFEPSLPPYLRSSIYSTTDTPAEVQLRTASPGTPPQTQETVVRSSNTCSSLG